MVSTRTQKGVPINPPKFLGNEQDPLPKSRSKKTPKKKAPAAARPKSRVTKTRKTAPKEQAAKKTAAKKRGKKKDKSLNVTSRDVRNDDGKLIRIFKDPRHAPVLSDSSESPTTPSPLTPTPSTQLHPRLPFTPSRAVIRQRSEDPSPKAKLLSGLGNVGKDIEGSRKRHSR